MNTTTFISTSTLLANAFNLKDNDPRLVAHEIAHALLLGGRVRREMDDSTASQIERMTNIRANSHELRACALQLQGLRALGQRPDVREMADDSWLGLINATQSRKFPTARAFEAAILAAQVAPLLIGRFVRVYTDFARYA